MSILFNAHTERTHGVTMNDTMNHSWHRIFADSGGLQFYDLSLSIIGLAGWLFVAIVWNDRALIVLNSFGLLLLLNNLVTILEG